MSEPAGPATTARTGAPIETPCLKICVMDASAGICAGCGRTRHEIGGWLGMTPQQRRAVMAQLPERLRGMAGEG
jgi:uncharacterized protein